MADLNARQRIALGLIGLSDPRVGAAVRGQIGQEQEQEEQDQAITGAAKAVAARIGDEQTAALGGVEALEAGIRTGTLGQVVEAPGQSAARADLERGAEMRNAGRENVPLGPGATERDKEHWIEGAQERVADQDHDQQAISKHLQITQAQFDRANTIDEVQRTRAAAAQTAPKLRLEGSASAFSIGVEEQNVAATSRIVGRDTAADILQGTLNPNAVNSHIRDRPEVVSALEAADEAVRAVSVSAMALDAADIDDPQVAQLFEDIRKNGGVDYMRDPELGMRALDLKVHTALPGIEQAAKDRRARRDSEALVGQRAGQVADALDGLASSSGEAVRGATTQAELEGATRDAVDAIRSQPLSWDDQSDLLQLSNAVFGEDSPLSSDLRRTLRQSEAFMGEDVVEDRKTARAASELPDGGAVGVLLSGTVEEVEQIMAAPKGARASDISFTDVAIPSIGFVKDIAGVESQDVDAAALGVAGAAMAHSSPGVRKVARTTLFGPLGALLPDTPNLGEQVASAGKFRATNEFVREGPDVARVLRESVGSQIQNTASAIITEKFDAIESDLALARRNVARAEVARDGQRIAHWSGIVSGLEQEKALVTRTEGITASAASAVNRLLPAAAQAAAMDRGSANAMLTAHLRDLGLVEASTTTLIADTSEWENLNGKERFDVIIDRFVESSGEATLSGSSRAGDAIASALSVSGGALSSKLDEYALAVPQTRDEWARSVKNWSVAQDHGLEFNEAAALSVLAAALGGAVK